jgi:hypothetical protein
MPEPGRALRFALACGQAAQAERMVMSEAQASFPVVREVGASFPDRRHFHAAVAALLAAGFGPNDLSVLASHDPLATAGEPDGVPGLLPAALGGEIKYIAPLTVAGIVLLSGGPIAAAVAALVGAGLGGAALKELFDDYTAPPHRAEFRAALEAGAALLWVRCDDPGREDAATRILGDAGGRYVHVHSRAARPDDAAAEAEPDE